MSRSEPDTTRRTLDRRAATALGLLVGFYLLAFGIVAALLVVIVAAVRGGHYRVQLLFMAAAAVAILRGVFYLDKDRNAPPPVRIEAGPEQQPELWAEATGVADALGAPRPDVIYLVHDANAFVYQESGLLGLRPGRVVLGIGMPLLAVLRTSELRAVLAHEFGHVSGGDTRFGPIVYRARESIERVVRNLEGGWLGAVFGAYFRLFMRLSMEVSRAQELAADTNAARLAGRAASARALEGVAIISGAFDLLIEQYVVPLWRRGRWPEDFYRGLHALCTEPARGDLLRARAAAIMEQETGTWDSHPALGDRVRRIESLPEGQVVDDQRPADELLRDRPEIERSLAAQLAAIATSGTAAPEPAGMTPTSWEDAAREVFGPAVAKAATRLTSAAIAVGGDWRRRGLDQALELVEEGRSEELARRLVPEIAEVAEEERARTVRKVLRAHLHAAISAELVREHGWRWMLSWGDLATAGGREGPAPVAMARAALSGPNGNAAVRRELGLWPGGRQHAHAGR